MKKYSNFSCPEVIWILGTCGGKASRILFICFEIEGQILTFKGSFDLDNL